MFGFVSITLTIFWFLLICMLLGILIHQALRGTRKTQEGIPKRVNIPVIFMLIFMIVVMLVLILPGLATTSEMYRNQMQALKLENFVRKNR